MAHRTWLVGDLKKASGAAALLNAQIRDPFNQLDLHQHTGDPDDGDNDLSGIDTIDFADQSTAPTTPGTLQRDTNHLKWHNGSGSVTVTLIDQAAGTASLRTLGTGATQAAAGNHSH